MDYKAKFISLINDESLPIEQRKKLEEIYNSCIGTDERIRKEIIYFLSRNTFQFGEDIDKYKSWIAWLEKQASKTKWTEEDYDEGYKDGCSETIKKACEWLNDKLPLYWGQVNADNTDRFVRIFKKAMEV